MPALHLVEGRDYVVTDTEAHHFPLGTTVTFVGHDDDGDLLFRGPDPVSSSWLDQNLEPHQVADTRAMAKDREAAAAEHLNARLVAAYKAAMAATHSGGYVQIHLGIDVIAALQARCEVEDEQAPAAGMVGNTLWGFPVVVADEACDAEHISVHTVTTIH